MIQHLSPSSLCLFKSAPSLWVGKYLKGWRDEAGPAAWRGSAVEAGLDVILYKVGDIAGSSLIKARERFEIDAQGDASPEVDKHRLSLGGYLVQAGEAVKDLPLPAARQFKIEVWLDGIEWPVIGYLDYLWPEFLVDLKTTERIPSEPRGDHVLQVALYSAATSRPAKLLYVSPKRSQWFDISEAQQEAGMKEARAIARNIRSLLALSADPDALLRALPLDFENYRWSANTKQLALQSMEM